MERKETRVIYNPEKMTARALSVSLYSKFKRFEKDVGKLGYSHIRLKARMSGVTPRLSEVERKIAIMSEELKKLKGADKH